MEQGRKEVGDVHARREQLWPDLPTSHSGHRGRATCPHQSKDQGWLQTSPSLTALWPKNSQ